MQLRKRHILNALPDDSSPALKVTFGLSAEYYIHLKAKKRATSGVFEKGKNYKTKHEKED